MRRIDSGFTSFWNPAQGLAYILIIITLTAFTACAPGERHQQAIVLTPFEMAAPPDSLPVIPWTDNETALIGQPPLFELNSPEGTSAKCWISACKAGFILHIVVTDNLHINTQSDAAIWDGDAIQIGIDANGSGVGSRPVGSAYVGADDASITVALTSGGPKAWAHYHGNPQKRNAIHDLKMDIGRDESTKQTTYSLHFDWTDFNMKPGMSDVMAFCVQINDTDLGSDQLRLKWGDGAGGNLRPGLFRKVRIGSPAEEFAAVLPLKTNLWTPTDSLRCLVALHTAHAWSLRIEGCNGESRSFSGTPTNDLKISRYILTIAPEALNPEAACDIILSAEQLAADKIRINPSWPGRQTEALLAALTTRASQSRDSLEKRHLTSVYEIVNDEWQRALKNVARDEYDALLCSEYAPILLEEVENTENLGEQLAAGRKTMVCSFRASSDSSVQFYKLLLPANLTAGKKYPVIVDLHGTGNPYSLAFFAPVSGKTIGTEEITENTLSAFVMQPWGRGNARYRGKAGTDIYDALTDLSRHFDIDTSRRYLTGFSMGGFGTWRHSVQWPERWTAVAVAAGRGDTVPPQEQMQKLKYLPVMIWHGNKDGAVSVNYAYSMEKALKSVGNRPLMHIVPDRGHQILANERRMIYEWLLEQPPRVR